MKRRIPSRILPVLFVAILILQACGTKVPPVTEVLPTKTLEPPKATDTPLPSPTSTTDPFARPTRTPNLTATYNAEQRETQGVLPNLTATLQAETWNTEVQSYFDAGYLTTMEGDFIKFKDLQQSRAELGGYRIWPLQITASNFYLSAHFKWTSAYRSADTSGCGFVFAEQKNDDHYAVFLDRSKVFFVGTEDHYYNEMKATRGTGRVNLGNPFDAPVDADFALIVNDAYAYVLVNGEVVGEYTLSQSKVLNGTIGLALLSGTNKDFGTRCEMTNIHVWLPEE